MERETVFFLNQEQETTYLAEVMRSEVLMGLHKALEQLPPQAGKIICMTYLEGKTNQETADELNLSIQTVKNQKQRGWGILKGKLPPDNYLTLIGYISLLAEGINIYK